MRVPRPKPPWPPIYFIMDQIKEKTGRSRNESNYQATSVDVLRTLQGGKAGGRASTQPPISVSVHELPCRHLQGLVLLLLGRCTHGRLAGRETQTRGRVACQVDARSTNLRAATRGAVPSVCDCILGHGSGCGSTSPGGLCSGSCPGRGRTRRRVDVDVRVIRRA